MKFHAAAFSIASLAAVSAIVGCGSGAIVIGPPKAPVNTSSPSPTPNTSGANEGTTACSAPAVLEGTYTSIDTSGLVAGKTYTEQSGDYAVTGYSSPSPTPTPTTPGAPTAPPSVSLPVPTPTGMVSVYYGEYVVPSFSGNVINGGTYTTAATTGCFAMTLTQNVGGTAGQARVHRVAQTATPAPNAQGFGGPDDPDDEAVLLDSGSLTSLSITNLTPTTGSGMFSFTNSAGTSVPGTLTITGSETFDNASEFRRRALDLSTHR